jgi:hypothetical protein
MGAGETAAWPTGESAEAALDPESDEFIGRALRWAKRRAGRLAPVLRRLAPIAARTVLGAAGGPAGAILGQVLREEELDESEWELEDLELLELGEADGEDESSDTVPGLSAEAEGLAEILASAAADAESEEEAAGLIGGVTIQILGPTPIRIRRMTPLMVRRATRLTRLLRRSRRTRPLVPVVASITKATTRSLMRRAAAGKPITPRTVTRTMAGQTARTLASPKRVARALANNVIKRRQLDRRAIARAER